MTQTEIKAVIIQVLKDIQAASAREWVDLDETACPIGALPGFDSLSAIEATVLVEERLGCVIEVETLFVSDNGKQAITLNDACELIANELAGRTTP